MMTRDIFLTNAYLWPWRSKEERCIKKLKRLRNRESRDVERMHLSGVKVQHGCLPRTVTTMCSRTAGILFQATVSRQLETCTGSNVNHGLGFFPRSISESYYMDKTEAKPKCCPDAEAWTRPNAIRSASATAPVFTRLHQCEKRTPISSLVPNK